METSVIILAGGSSERFGQHKAFAELLGRPLISHVLGKVQGISEEVLVVVSSADQTGPFLHLLGNRVKIVVDRGESHSPLVGALAGFENASGDYALLLPSDTPLVSKDVLMLLLDLCVNVDAVVPRWPNGYIEPLHAVYRTRSALHAAKTALSESHRDMQSMISLLRKVRYVSTLVLRQFDPDLNTFFNVNTKLDLEKATRIASSRKVKQI